MALSPINFSGMIQSTTEIGGIKANEDAKPEVNQQNIQVNMAEKQEEKSHSVNQLEQKQDKYDFGDGKGNGGYQRRKNNKKKDDKKDDLEDGVVIKKDTHASFDMKI